MQHDAPITMLHCGNGVLRVMSSAGFSTNICANTKKLNVVLQSKDMLFGKHQMGSHMIHLSSHKVHLYRVFMLWLSCEQLLPSELWLSPVPLELPLAFRWLPSGHGVYLCNT